MFSSVLTAFSGLLGFSKGLDVISNNVANLNTFGFKASELQFRELFYRFGSEQNGGAGRVGQGLDTGSTRTSFRQGDIEESNRALDVAIDGNGFFVLRKDGETLYTRAGQFQFDADGFLIDPTTQARVAGLSDGRLIDISIAGLRVNPPRPTTEIKLVGNLDRDPPAADATPPQINNVSLIDGSGATRNLTIKFTNNSSVTPRSWLVEISDDRGVVDTGELRFGPDIGPAAGFNKIVFDYERPGIVATTVTLDFGEPGSAEGVTDDTSSTNTVSVDTQDGIAPGDIVDLVFNEEGKLAVTYSNGQNVVRDQLALALFENPQNLVFQGDSVFSARDDESRVLATSGEQGAGNILGRRLERSNVELTEQFTDIVVVQRGFQASSQVISVANEMAQQLLDLRSRR